MSWRPTRPERLDFMSFQTTGGEKKRVGKEKAVAKQIHEFLHKNALKAS